MPSEVNKDDHGDVNEAYMVRVITDHSDRQYKPPTQTTSSHIVTITP